MVLEERDKGCVLFLPFEENSGNVTLDWSGNDNSGIIYGATWVDGKFGKALKFDGVDDYVDCGNDSSLDVTDITIETWIYPTSWTHAPYPGIVSKRDTWSGMDWELYYDRGSARIRFAIAQNLAIDGVNTNPPLNKWSHLVYTKSGSIHKLYLNGINTDTSKYTITIPTGDRVRIGVLGGDNIGNAFNGLIDEVRIYNRALSEEEIKAHFLAGVRKFYPIRFAHLRTFPGCVLNLPMEERSGTRVYDQSGFKNHGTIYGATWSYGKIGRGLSFDGVDDYVEVPDSASLRLEKFTVMGWFKSKTYPDAVIRPIAFKGTRWAWSKFNYALVVSGAGLKVFGILGDGTNYYLTSIKDITPDVWHHAAITYDKNYFRLFVDGVEVTPATSLSVTPYISSDTLWTSRSDYAFNGTIDEVRIYNRVLTPKEILTHYFEGLKTHQMNPIITRQVA